MPRQWTLENVSPHSMVVIDRGRRFFMSSSASGDFPDFPQSFPLPTPSSSTQSPNLPAFLDTKELIFFFGFVLLDTIRLFSNFPELDLVRALLSFAAFGPLVPVLARLLHGHTQRSFCPLRQPPSLGALVLGFLTVASGVDSVHYWRKILYHFASSNP
ncbi:hypothetical protein DM02DRAFT_395239 [Periconia macrospinosa]|uniref:Uncharacterized protein n=1 Tax=Periconia macrospinosa TaxID=97972 RepID=A0A2V1DQ68_9PLEO|nr:hypothetical protein DM02DRAFT_395239 [Periconia macrospinosa]